MVETARGIRIVKRYSHKELEDKNTSSQSDPKHKQTGGEMMTKQVTITDMADLNRYEHEIRYNLKQSQEKLKKIVNEKDAFDVVQ